MPSAQEVPGGSTPTEKFGGVTEVPGRLSATVMSAVLPSTYIESMGTEQAGV